MDGPATCSGPGTGASGTGGIDAEELYDERRSSYRQASQPIISHVVGLPYFDVKLKRLKFRIRVLSVFLTGLIIVTFGLGFITQVPRLVHLMESVARYVPPAWAPTTAGYVAGKSVLGVVSLCLSLVACIFGYCGVKHTRKDLLCLYWLLCALGGICGLVALVYTVVILQVQAHAVAAAEEYLVTCDAAVHCPSVTGVPADAVVDCLAASIWTQHYVRRYEYGDPMPGYCLGEFLECDYHDYDYDRFLPDFVALLPPELRRPPNQGFSRRISLSPGAMGVDVVPMPRSPRTECHAREAEISGFHEASSLLPGIWQHLRNSVYIHLLLQGIAMLLAFIGFHWGKNIHRHIQQLPFFA